MSPEPGPDGPAREPQSTDDPMGTSVLAAIVVDYRGRSFLPALRTFWDTWAHAVSYGDTVLYFLSLAST